MPSELGFSAMDDFLPGPPSLRFNKRSTLQDDSASIGADLSVSGFHALFFDDDAVASFVNSRGALVPWNGDESLLIDRYDVRHLLQDLSTVRKRRAPSSSLDVSLEELDYERYRDLDGLGGSDPSSDEVSKSVAGEYQSVPFSYTEGVSQNGVNVESRKKGPGFEPPFPVPHYLLSKLPPSEKIHQIIAGTAKFVSEHGGQSEIILRVKQGKNPTFGFLHPDHDLHEYFRYLVDNAKLVGGTSKKSPKAEQVSRATCEGLSLLGSTYGTGDDDDDNDDTVKPQRLNSVEVAELLNDGAVAVLASAHDQAAAGLVVSNDASSGSGISGIGQTNCGLENEVASAINDKVEVINQQAVVDGESFQISQNRDMAPEPPLALKRVIEKMVEFILRNGKDFEMVVRDRDKTDGRFQFLLPWNEYHSFYLNVLNAAQEETTEKGKKVVLNLKREKTSPQDTSRANQLGPLLQDKSKGNSNTNTSQVAEHKVGSRSLTRAEKKTKLLIGKKEFIPPNKNNIGQFNYVKSDRPTALRSDSAGANVTGAAHRVPVGHEANACVVANDQLGLSGDKDEDYGMTAEAAAAVVMAATGGMWNIKQDNSNNRTSSSGQGQKRLFTNMEAIVGCRSECGNASGGVVRPDIDDVGIAKAVAQAAAFAVAHEADSADVLLTPAEKLKAERLRKAKMFGAMIRSGQSRSEGISWPLGQSVGARTEGSEAAGSGSNLRTDLINSEIQGTCNSQAFKCSEGSMKADNRDRELATEGGTLNVLQSVSSGSKHEAGTVDNRVNRSHECCSKVLNLDQNHEDRENHMRKSSHHHHHDSSDVKVQKKTGDHDSRDRNHHKSKRSYAEESVDYEDKDSQRRTSHRSAESEDKEKRRKKKSYLDHEGDTHGKHRHSKHKRRNTDLLNSAEEKQSVKKHHYRSLSPCEERKHCCTSQKESQECTREGIDEPEKSTHKKIVEDGIHMKLVSSGKPGCLPAVEVPDDIRAKVRALLSRNS